MLSFGPRGPALNRYFLGAVAIILLCSLGLGASVLSAYHRTFEASSLGLSRLLAFRTVLDAARAVSAERAPTNAALGRIAVGEAARTDALLAARRATDAAIGALNSTPALADTLAALKQHVEQGRALTDALLDQPQPARDPAQIERAINEMFASYDLTKPLVDAAMIAMLRTGSNLMGRAITARMIGEMRDYSGRLGSYTVIAIAQGRPMTAEQSVAFATTKGRVLQLWQHIRQQVAERGSPRVMEARRDTERHFLQDGLRIIEATHEKLAAGETDLTTAGFTRAIVPSFAPIERLRDAYLDATISDLETQRDAARCALTVASATVAVALAIELMLLLAGQRLFFAPLLKAREETLRLAGGHLEQMVPSPLLRGEMRGLFEALATLRVKLIERDRLDAERNLLEQRLRHQADTDGLTGVLNRGALERQAEQMAQTPGPVGLILLDLDHFKSVNDRFGHTAGDAVLRSTAQRLRPVLREEDILARFGGEEFAILIVGKRAETIGAIATRLRLTIESEPFALPDNRLIALTASLGTATAMAHPGMWPMLIEAADGALYEAKTGGRNRVVASL
jgi:diguanylate cyclase (GGDEF)-like protein